MPSKVLLIALALAFITAGCATRAEKVKVIQEVPRPAEGEVAVFGGIRLVEEINIFMPAEDQDGSVYIRPAGEDTTIKIGCSDSGEFGVFLKPGKYKVLLVSVEGYTFRPHITLTVPSGFRAAYAGIIELDGTPTGVEPASGDTCFVYSIMDESAGFVDRLRREAPGTERQVVKSLFVTDGAVATGDYPNKVFRADDIRRGLGARTAAVEEVVTGGLVALTYLVNPVWLLTFH